MAMLIADNDDDLVNKAPFALFAVDKTTKTDSL